MNRKGFALEDMERVFRRLQKVKLDQVNSDNPVRVKLSVREPEIVLDNPSSVKTLRICYAHMIREERVLEAFRFNLGI